MTRKRGKLSEKTIASAIKLAVGNVAQAARNLGVERSGLYLRIMKSEMLQAMLASAREGMVDNAESALGLATLRGEAWAVCFTLKCLGKDRGYIERGEVNHDVRLVVSHSAEDLTDEQLAAIASRAIASRGSQRLIGPADGPEEPD
jgi:hypothetical protein